MTIKGLFFVNESIEESSGIGKKILSQYKSFNNSEFSMQLCYLKSRHGLIKRFFDNNPISSYSDTKVGKLLLEMSYSILYREIIKNEIRFIYIRYIHFSTPMFVLFLYALKRANVVIYFEIPTYPYDSESKPLGGISIIKRFVEKKLRYPMGNIIDRIVTFSDHRYIWGTKTINISNAVDLSVTPLVKKTNHADNSLHFIGVAIISFWHGYDRMIHSLAKYYKDNNNEDDRKVFFHIVGDGPEKANLESLTDKCKLHDYVEFHGIQTGTSLDKIFNHCDLAIDSLGRHRSANSHNNSLKSKEYIARGLPFIKSHIDDSLYSNVFYDIDPDESLFDLQPIINWFDKLELSPEKIRRDAEKYYSWDIQIKKISDSLQK
jgi:hypothetical protein